MLQHVFFVKRIPGSPTVTLSIPDRWESISNIFRVGRNAGFFFFFFFFAFGVENNYILLDSMTLVRDVFKEILLCNLYRNLRKDKIRR